MVQNPFVQTDAATPNFPGCLKVFGSVQVLPQVQQMFQVQQTALQCSDQLSKHGELRDRSGCYPKCSGASRSSASCAPFKRPHMMSRIVCPCNPIKIASGSVGVSTRGVKGCRRIRKKWDR